MIVPAYLDDGAHAGERLSLGVNFTKHDTGGKCRGSCCDQQEQHDFVHDCHAAALVVTVLQQYSGRRASRSEQDISVGMVSMHMQQACATTQEVFRPGHQNQNSQQPMLLVCTR